MPLEPGAKLGPYEIVSPIGAGGMGEVWKARDARLNRDVAIKTSRVGFDGRFRKEALAIAALNHRNICTLYDVGPDYLVMEYIEGPTLAERIRQGPMGLEEALDVAGQIAQALDAAHEKGIVHRDLKPANVKLRPDGSVKVLDFGLARAGDGPGVVAVDASTVTSAPTGAGTIFGTPGYMSPERARGLPADKRADIWAFGIVLYEMVTGARLFDGPTMSDTIAAVLKTEPDLRLVPAPLRGLLGACLEKDARKRLRDIGDWSRLLDYGTSEAAPVRNSGRRWQAAALGALVALLAATAGFLANRFEPAETRTDIVTPGASDFAPFALSPDGSRIVYVSSRDGTPRLWLRPLNSVSPLPIPNTEGATDPFWSPDSRWVGFWADATLKRIDLNGGMPQSLTDVSVGAGADWGEEGTILFALNAASGVFQVPATGGRPAQITKPEPKSIGHRFPRFLPDRKHFLYFSAGPESGIYLASLGGGEAKRLTASDSAGEYLRSGWLLWVQRGSLMARRLDISSGRLSGEAVALAQQVGVSGPGAAALSVSRSGLVAWRAGTNTRGQLIWFDRSGQRLGSVGPAGELSIQHPALSPDGRRIAATQGAEGAGDIWLVEGARSIRFTSDPANDRFPIWSPDGSRVVFTSNRKGPFDLYEKPADASAPEQPLLASAEPKIPEGWSPDGRNIIYFTTANAGDLMVLPLTGDRKPWPFLSTPFREEYAAFSGDGMWVAYQSNESGRNEIYVRSFPGPGGIWQVSAGGGTWPRWAADGKELYYLGAGNKLMAVPIAVDGSALAAGQPMPLFAPGIVATGNHPQYDVSRDGRFLVLVESGSAGDAPITLLQNWKPPK